MPLFVASARATAARIVLAHALLLACPVAVVTASCPVERIAPISYGCGFTSTDVVAYATAGAGLRNLRLYDIYPTNSFLPYNGGGGDFSFDWTADVATNPGNWNSVSGTGHGLALGNGPQYSPQPDETVYAVDDMVVLSISGGGLPPGMMIRESPALHSPGLSTCGLLPFPPQTFSVACYFDVFTEMSLDGGQTWASADQSLHLTFESGFPTATASGTWGALKLLYR